VCNTVRDKKASVSHGDMYINFVCFYLNNLIYCSCLCRKNPLQF